MFQGSLKLSGLAPLVNLYGFCPTETWLWWRRLLKPWIFVWHTAARHSLIFKLVCMQTSADILVYLSLWLNSIDICRRFTYRLLLFPYPSVLLRHCCIEYTLKTHTNLLGFNWRTYSKAPPHSEMAMARRLSPWVSVSALSMSPDLPGWRVTSQTLLLR